MKKIVSFLLVMTLVTTTGFSTAFANPHRGRNGVKLQFQLSKRNFLPPGIAKRFRDIDDYGWAEDAIKRMVEKGVIKGIGDGLFAPKNAVTKLEAVVMALRVMGEEETAANYKERIRCGNKHLRGKDSLQEWAYGYVALAEEKGILDEADILYFKLNEPAKRHEVAKYIVRALGYEDEAEDHMNADLDFKDAPFIPQGSVGYIYVANKENIITGYRDETFRPLNTVTRAEMAVMVSRLDDKIDNDEDEIRTYKSEIEEIDEDYEWIEIEVKGKDKRFDITRKTKVIFEDNKNGDIEDIKEGDKVYIKVNEDDEVTYVKVYRQLYDEYKGEVEEIDEDYEWIEIEVKNKDKRFDITRKTKVVFEDNKNGDIEDVKEGDEVYVKVNKDDEVEYIKIYRELEYDTYKGFLIQVDKDKIAILSSKKIFSFEVDSDIKVEFEDKKGYLKDLIIGDEVELTVDEDDEIDKIEVNRKYNAVEVTGRLIGLYKDEEQIAIKQDNKVKIYDLKDSVKVYINDKREQLSDLEKNDNVLFILDDDNEVKEIRVYRLIVLD